MDVEGNIILFLPPSSSGYSFDNKGKIILSKRAIFNNTMNSQRSTPSSFLFF